MMVNSNAHDALTAAEKRTLNTAIKGWREQAEREGPQHALWDVIADAEALLADKKTLRQGTKLQVFVALLAYL